MNHDSDELGQTPADLNYSPYDGIDYAYVMPHQTDDSTPRLLAEFLALVEQEVASISDAEHQAAIDNILKKTGFFQDEVTGELWRESPRGSTSETGPQEQYLDVDEAAARDAATQAAHPVFVYESPPSDIPFVQLDEGDFLSDLFTTDDGFARITAIREEIEAAESKLAEVTRLLELRTANLNRVEKDTEQARRLADSHETRLKELRREGQEIKRVATLQANSALNAALEKASSIISDAIGQAEEMKKQAAEEAAGLVAAASSEAEQIMHAGRCWVDAIVAAAAETLPAAAETLPAATVVDSYYADPHPVLAAALAKLEVAARLRDSAAVAMTLDRLFAEDDTGNGRWLLRHVLAAGLRAASSSDARSHEVHSVAQHRERVLSSSMPPMADHDSNDMLSRSSRYLLWRAGVNAGVASRGEVSLDSSEEMDLAKYSAFDIDRGLSQQSGEEVGLGLVMPEARKRVRVVLNVVAKNNGQAMTIVIAEDDPALGAEMNDSPRSDYGRSVDAQTSPNSEDGPEDEFSIHAAPTPAKRASPMRAARSAEQGSGLSASTFTMVGGQCRQAGTHKATLLAIPLLWTALSLLMPPTQAPMWLWFGLLLLVAFAWTGVVVFLLPLLSRIGGQTCPMGRSPAAPTRDWSAQLRESLEIRRSTQEVEHAMN